MMAVGKIGGPVTKVNDSAVRQPTDVERQVWLGNAYRLTSRELQVVRVVAEGKSDKEIAMMLGIRRKTVSKHLENILEKMGCSSRAEVVARALREGLVD